MNYPSRLVENAVHEISRLPGIGKKTALRLALHLLKEETATTLALSEALVKLREQTTWCRLCHNLAEGDLCSVCASMARDRSIVCVVEDIRDVMAIENTASYRGLYHVLGGVINPAEGVGPSDLKIETLLARLASGEGQEVILALSPTMQGDTTGFYLQKRLKDSGVRVSLIARGVPIGGELEYADEITLGRALVDRTLLPPHESV